MEWLKILKAAAENARGEVLNLFGSVEAGETFGVGAGGDIAHKIDVVAEKAVIETLHRHGVSCNLVSEESGFKKIGGKSKFYLIADSLDGTINALHNIPFFAVSLAVADGPKLSGVKVGLVMDLYRGVIFSAERGRGAFYEWEKRLTPSSVTDVKDAVIFLQLNALKDKKLLSRLYPVIMRAKRLRHLGSSSLEICYVAEGSVDAFVEIQKKLRVPDVAAAYLILKEAGGLVITQEGVELEADLKPAERVSFIAGNPELCKNILKLLS